MKESAESLDEGENNATNPKHNVGRIIIKLTEQQLRNILTKTIQESINDNKNAPFNNLKDIKRRCDLLLNNGYSLNITNNSNKKKGLNESCWKGYKKVGGKMKNGKMVPNCVPINKSVKEASNLSQQAAIAIHMKEKNIKPKNEVYGEVDESKNIPTNPKLWATSLAWARSKYDVCPSAYCNGAAAKRYKSKGGKWKKSKK
jgi:hypothetical protein